MGLIWIACFVLFFLVHVFVMVPQRENKMRIEKQFVEKKQMYESALRVTQQATKDSLSKQIKTLRHSLGDFVIDSRDSANLTFDIRQIANEKQISSISIKTQQNNTANSPVDKCKYIGENLVDISFDTGFSQFAAFLNALERHRPVVFVDKFKIIRSDKDNLGHKVNMSLAFFVKK